MPQHWKSRAHESRHSGVRLATSLLALVCLRRQLTVPKATPARHQTLKLGAQAVACGGHAQRCQESWSRAGGGRGSLQCGRRGCPDSVRWKSSDHRLPDPTRRAAIGFPSLPEGHWGSGDGASLVHLLHQWRLPDLGQTPEIVLQHPRRC